MKKNKIRYPIVLKLVVITGVLLLTATLSIAYRSSYLFQTITEPRERDANGVAAEAKAAQVTELLSKYIDKTRMIASLIYNQGNGSSLGDAATEAAQSEVHKSEITQKKSTQVQTAEVIFDNDPDFIALQIFNISNGTELNSYTRIKNNYFTDAQLSSDFFVGMQIQNPFPTKSVFAGDVVINNSSGGNKLAMFSIGIPFVKSETGVITHIAVAYMRLDGLQKPFSKVTERTFFLVGKNGKLLAHPNDQMVLRNKNMSFSEIVKKALSSTTLQGEGKFFDFETKSNVIASYARTGFGPVVIAQTSEDVILAPARFMKREAFFITGLVLSGAVFFVFLFSISITNPIEKLVEVTGRIAAGDFSVQSMIRSKDEMGELATSVDAMVTGLKERDKIKNVMNKFHGSAISDNLLKGNLQLGGVKKDVVVFFSDIRDFTKFSEGHTPEEVVSMLNEYFEVMVSIVTKNFGVVDKFVGDAMMAIWGAPNTSGKDNYFAIKSCIEMRLALEALNKSRLERGMTEIKIGMGLHSGPAISGTIGSSERMEYTVIGDTVNTASRIESSTKLFGKDLLVSMEVLEGLLDNFVYEFAGEAAVHGKVEPLKMYSIKGYIDESGNKILVQTKYSDYEASGKSEKATVV